MHNLSERARACVCVCLPYASVYVCELIRRAAMSVRRPSSCPSLLPPFPSFPSLLPSPLSPCLPLHFPLLSLTLLLVLLFFCLLPLRVPLVKLCDAIKYRGSRCSACVCLCQCIPPFLLCLPSWLCQAFCSSAQQQSPERAGTFHFLHRKRGVGLSQKQKN